MRSLYITLFGGSFRPAQRSDMMKKKEKHARSAYVTLFGGSFRTAELTDKGKHVHSTYVTFFGGSFRTAQRADIRKKRGARAVFLPFLPGRTQKKLNMIAREFEFVVDRMY